MHLQPQQAGWAQLQHLPRARVWHPLLQQLLQLAARVQLQQLGALAGR
jgi:hypothetical protein